MFFNSTVVPFSFKEQQDPKDPSWFEEQRQESALRSGMRSLLAQQTLRGKMRRRRRCEVFILKNKTKQNKREKKRRDEKKVIENE